MPLPSAILTRQIERAFPTAMQRVMTTFAAEIQKDAPRGVTRGAHRGGSLIASVTWDTPTPTTGVIRMEFYGRYVDTGTPALSGSQAAQRARTRYAAAVGHPVTHPNSFVDRAWDSPAVRQARAQLAVDLVRD